MENSYYVFHHPCNGCLSKPLCRGVCEDFRDHTELAEMSIFGIWLVVYACLLITLFCYLDEWMPNLYANIIIFGYIIVYYGIMIFDIMKNYDDFNRMKWWEKIIIACITPVGIPAARIWEYIDYKTDWTTNFKYRYNKKIRT